MSVEIYLDEKVKNKYDNNPYRIPLRNKDRIIVEFALVEENDFQRVNDYKWHLTAGYANSTIDGRNIKMHHFVFKKPKENHIIDHINEDKLDNRQCNLREVSRSANRNNISKTDTTTSSQYKGVNYVKRRSVFRSRYDGILLYYGKDERQAALMYDIYTFQKFGENANNNKLISYEDAIKHEFSPKEKIERELPKYISMTNEYFRVKRNFRSNESVFYFKTLKEAKQKVDELNLQINHTLLMEELLYKFHDIPRNANGIAFILYKDQEILVSDEDWHKLNKERWYIDKNTGYAFNNDLKTMHRLLLPCEDTTKVINHKNGNRIDNRRENLEIVTATENAHQKKSKLKNCSSQYFGVVLHKPTNKWMSRLKKDHKEYYLGLYENEIDAAKAYNKKAIELYGQDKANLNILV